MKPNNAVNYYCGTIHIETAAFVFAVLNCVGAVIMAIFALTMFRESPYLLTFVMVSAIIQFICSSSVIYGVKIGKAGYITPTIILEILNLFFCIFCLIICAYCAIYAYSLMDLSPYYTTFNLDPSKPDFVLHLDRVYFNLTIFGCVFFFLCAVCSVSELDIYYKTYRYLLLTGGSKGTASVV
ncbi:hypothetical protein L596_024863 [Steinernema carpocapsae]|uniref:MARVEL domain-containing protein n=1 Tax=Steinernema carpocapsae TaxID=34508 RepID=A0A4U5M631_STECR|nr:hypothetical protein L596_024863 [Steinernema carpocapsae]